MSEQISGTVEKVVYRNTENGFSVLTIQCTATEKVTVTGSFPDLHEGEFTTFGGRWGFHTKFGRQFIAENVESKLPSSVIGIKKYLASGLIKGIGPKFAERIVKKFGAKTLEVIDNDPDQLYGIDGMGPKRVQIIIQAWDDQKEISQVMVFLQEREVSTAFAVKMYKKYGQDTIEKVQQNPYRLIEDIWGVGFKMSDQLALKLGFEKHSLYRIKAGIHFCTTEAVSNGHLYAEISPLKQAVIKILELDDAHHPLLKQALHELYRQEKIILLSYDDAHYITLPQYYYLERGIAKKLEKLKESKGKHVFESGAVYDQTRIVDARGVALNEDQQRGILSAVQNKVTVITGGPGTGKTTLVKRLLDVLEKKRVKCRLAAPTGRAAKRMFESTGRSTETLHRLLEFKPSIMNFARNEENALELDFLIIDEASMIDVFLMHAVLKALPQHAHLVLLGDVDQLPSVGAGNVLNDIIASKKVAVTRLIEIFRQAQDSLIIVNAHKVNNGEFPTSYIPGSRRDFLFIKENEPENIFGLLRDIYTKRLPGLGIDLRESITLVPMNRGVVGTQRINQELQMILNPKASAEISRFGTVYRVGDRVMQIRNNYDKFVFNGDIGDIESIDQVNQKMMIKFDSRVLEYDFGELNEIALSYAVSIHKSQGSEFQAVIIPIFMQHFILLQRNLIYTAITRAKKLCIVVGQSRAIAMGIKNNKGVERITFLEQFLTTDLEAR